MDDFDTDIGVGLTSNNKVRITLRYSDDGVVTLTCNKKGASALADRINKIASLIEDEKAEG